MGNSVAGFGTEVRISPRLLLGGLMLLAGLLYFGAESLGYGWQIVDRTISVVLVVLVLVVSGWTLCSRYDYVGRWFTLGALVTVVYLAAGWMEVPEILALGVVPVAFAMPVLDFPATLMMALVQSVLLTIVSVAQPSALPTAGVTLLSVWLITVSAYATHAPVRQLVKRLEDAFERGHQFLETARDQKMHLEQALEAFASANRQLALANERTAALRGVAEEAQRAKTAFVANVSHEFRTPLNMIIGLVDLMVEAPEIYSAVLSPEMREDLEVIHRNCEHLSAMINDVLDLARMEAGRLTLHRDRVCLRDVIDGSVEAVHPLLDKKHLAVHISIPEGIGDVYCDRTRIQQVILNLISNAARFTEEGEIDIRLLQDDHQVTVSVRDTGAGIAPQDAAAIFEPFLQGRLLQSKEGTGLGLSISRRFVELHGGRMWLESELDVGTTFYFTLPISPPIEHLIRPGHAIREDWVWREHAFRVSRNSYSDDVVRPRMVVFDEAGELATWLEHTSDTTEYVRAGSFSDIARALEECPAHAVILNAPDVATLWSLTSATQHVASGTPIIGCVVGPTLQRAREARALGHLVKPVTRMDLAQAIQAVGRPVKRVLVVDDDPDVLALFGRMLEIVDSSLEILFAESGAIALALIEQTRPDLMLLDMMMPEMDGWQVLAALERNGAGGAVPTFFVSAQDPSDHPSRSRFILATMDEGISLSKLLQCSEALSALLLQAETAPDLVPV